MDPEAETLAGLYRELCDAPNDHARDVAMRRVALLRARAGDWTEVLADPSPAPPELAEYLARRSVGTLRFSGERAHRFQTEAIELLEALGPRAALAAPALARHALVLPDIPESDLRDCHSLMVNLWEVLGAMGPTGGVGGDMLRALSRGPSDIDYLRHQVAAALAPADMPLLEELYLNSPDFERVQLGVQIAALAGPQAVGIWEKLAAMAERHAGTELARMAVGAALLAGPRGSAERELAVELVNNFPGSKPAPQPLPEDFQASARAAFDAAMGAVEKDARRRHFRELEDLNHIACLALRRDPCSWLEIPIAAFLAPTDDQFAGLAHIALEAPVEDLFIKGLLGAFGRRASAGAAPALVAAAETSVRDVTAAMLLEKIPVLDPALQERLLVMLDGHRVWMGLGEQHLRRALACSAAADPSLLDKLAARLSSANPLAAAAALWLLSEVDTAFARRYLPQVYALTCRKHLDQTLRAVAESFLTAVEPTEEALQRDLELLTDRDHFTRLRAIRRLAGRGAELVPYTPQLVRALDDDESIYDGESVRIYAAAALSKVGPLHPDAIPALVRLVDVAAEEDEPWDVLKSSLMKALVPHALHAAPAADGILAILGYGGWASRNAALILGILGLHADKAVPLILKWMDSYDAKTYLNALRHYGRKAAAALETVAREAVVNPDPELRDEAWEAVRAICAS